MNYKMIYIVTFVLLRYSSFCLSQPAQRLQTPKPVPSRPMKKNAATIAYEMCVKYMEARFTITKIPSLVLGDPDETVNITDCHTAEPLIVGGKSAQPKEFPHMALIGYGSNQKSIEWKCGGSLISDRFVLSAAHCSAHRDQPKWARLGELDLSSEKDDAKPRNYKIISQHFHPEYQYPNNYNDIILYKLHQAVQFSPYIRPICLYPYKRLRKSDTKAAATGWGQTAVDEIRSDKLLKATVNIINNNKCKMIFESDKRSFSKGYNSSITVCAGDFKEGKDTCNGDSGGPLQIPFDKHICTYLQIGITSLGSFDCGDKQTPGIYTHVAFYLEWIQSIVWP